MTARRPSEDLIGELINNRFLVGKFVAGGSFGSFHLGTDTQIEKDSGGGQQAEAAARVAIKLESKESPQPQLHIEYYYYNILGRARFIPTIHGIGPCGGSSGGSDCWHALVMDLLGPSLLSMRDRCGGTFSVVTVTNLTIQLINIFDYVHLHGILYRDIKPENFLFGLPNTDKWCTVMLIDLGFCKRYLDARNRHIPFVRGKPIAGTQRYMSVNNHLGYELGRRDDLEAMIYMIIYLHKATIPWQGLQGTAMEKNKQTAAIKQSISAEELCRDMPIEFALFAKYVRQLGFEEMPRYRHWWNRFRVALLRLGVRFEDQVMDWDRGHVPKDK